MTHQQKIKFEISHFKFEGYDVLNYYINPTEEEIFFNELLLNNENEYDQRPDKPNN